MKDAELKAIISLLVARLNENDIIITQQEVDDHTKKEANNVVIFEDINGIHLKLITDSELKILVEKQNSVVN